MALTITQIGSEIVTEKKVVRAVTNVPLGAVTSVIMEVMINGLVVDHTLEHLPILGTIDTFDFEINSIIKDYFASEFLALNGANQTTIENVLVALNFQEVTAAGVQPTQYGSSLIVKNITQDIFEIEEFDLADYDCGDNGSTSSKLLTSSPSTIPIGDNTSVHVSCYKVSYDVSLLPKQEWTIETYLNGAFVAQTTEGVTVPNRTITGFIPVGKHDISTYRFDFDSSTGIDEVRIYIRDILAPNTARSETKTFVFNKACEKSITLSWLNEFGTQDTHDFLGNITRTGKYTDSTFKRTRPVNPASTDLGDLVYKSSYNYEYDLFSDRMPEEHVQWLSKILINKRAAIQGAGGNYTGALTATQLTPSLTAVNQYGTPVDGGNGFMYVPPFLGNDILKINISTGVLSTIGTFAGVNPKWFAGKRAPNGKIYFIPNFDDNVLVLDPSNDTTVQLPVPTSTGAFQKWKGIEMTAAGIIYCPPANGATTFLKIDTTTDTVTEFGSLTDDYFTSCLASNGEIYSFGFANVPFLKMNATTEAVSTFGNQGAVNVQAAQSYEVNGFVYGFGTTTHIYKIDISTDAVTLITYASIGVPVAVNAIVEVTLGQDGNFYILPENGSDLWRYNPLTNVADNVTTIQAAQNYYTSGTADTGEIFGVPSGADQVVKIALTTAEKRYYPIVITTEETILEDKFTPETIFRLKFRLANRRKGLK